MATKQSGGTLRWVVVVLAIVVIAAGGVWYFNHGSGDTPQYQGAPVTRGDLTQVVTASGTLNPVLNVTVGSQVSGLITRLYVDFNSVVKSNEVIAEIDPSTYQAQLNQAQANLANAKANLELQEANLKRAAELFTNKLLAESDYDTAAATRDEASAQVEIEEATVTNATANLGYCKIRSPVDGVVISRAVVIGQTVASSFSTPTLFNIANDLTKMQIDANVSEADIGTVAEGQDVSFTVDAFPDGKFTGKVIQIRNSPTTVQNVVTYDVVIAVSNPDLKLRPGMTANASLITAERSGVLRIPNAAFRFRPPEQPANTSFFARLFGGGSKSPVTNTPPAVAATGAGATNALAASGGEAPLTGNEPPEELQRRVGQMRANGENVPPEIMAKLRSYYQSGVLQPPMRGGGPGGGGLGARGGGSRGSQPAFRTVYVLPTNSPSADAAPQAVRVRSGINDGSNTEIISGLNEGDQVIIGLKLPLTASAPPAGGQPSPFGGGGGGFGGPRGGR
jgi:HlyD family secretion protein